MGYPPDLFLSADAFIVEIKGGEGNRRIIYKIPQIFCVDNRYYNCKGDVHYDD